MRHLLRAHLAQLPAYKPVEPPEVLARRWGHRPEDLAKLDANENPYGPLPVVQEALARLDRMHRYPDPESREVRQRLAERFDLPVEHLVVGAGADELLELLVRVLIDPGDAVVIPTPTFGMYAFLARVYAARIVEVPRGPDFALPIEALEDAVRMHQAKVLFLATPNNPDGSLPAREERERLLNLPAVVVLDEAYIEFADEAMGREAGFLTQVPHRENLVVLRTFSKAAGLAGLRVGYGAFPRWLAEALWKVKQPYNVSVAAQVAAAVTLDHWEDLRDIVARLRAERERLHQELARIPYLQVYPSRANFLLVRLRSGSARALQTYLAQEHGILVRYFATPGLENCLRISVGLPEHTERLLQALRTWSPRG